MDENLPSFPAYDPVHPKGVPHLPDPRQQKPLLKMVKMLMVKPKRIVKPPTRRLKARKKLTKFY